MRGDDALGGTQATHPFAKPKPHAFPIKKQFGDTVRVEFDRSLPLVCVHDRSTRCHPHDQSLELLTRSTPNHVIVDQAPALAEAHPLLESVLRVASKEYGRCALVELAGPPEPAASTLSTAAPRVTVSQYSPSARVASAIDAFEKELTRLKIRGLRPRVARADAPKFRAVLDPFRDEHLSRVLLQIDPVFFSPGEGKLRGLLLRDFAERLHPALAHLAHALLEAKGKQRLGNPCAFGRRHLSPRVDRIERQLARVARSFDLLLLLTPTNGEAAYQRFVASGCEKRPDLLYRTIFIDPDELRRDIFQLPIEHVDDPILARLLREQRDHIDSQLRMVAHRNTTKCLYSSLQVYGSVEDKLHRVARGVVEAFASDEPCAADSPGELIDAARFCQLVLEEFDYYKKQSPSFDAKVVVRDDVSSLTVSENTLLVPTSTALGQRRAEALLAHEVGTHLLTHFNGKAQPLELMKSGLAGYDQLQEGLAVVAEYLAGGLTPERLRLLAARVIAVRHLLRGADFVEVFREVHKTLALPRRPAFFVTLRVFRAGGFTKDTIYLRGVLDVLEHLRKNRPFETLLVGKFSAAHEPLVHELRCRQLLRAPTLLPRALKTKSGKKHLAALQGQQRSVFDLCQRETP